MAQKNRFRWPEQFLAWDSARAHRAGTVLSLFATAMIALDSVTLERATGLSLVLAASLGAFTLLNAVIFGLFVHQLPMPVYTLLPVLPTGLVLALALSRSDSSAATQIFLFVPVLYAATQLRPAGVCLVVGLALIAQAILVLNLLPFPNAFRDLVYFAAVTGVISVFLVQGIIAQQRLADVLRHQATVDALTGLVNRRVLDDAARSAIVAARDNDGTALVLLDIDNFKQINDAHGHPVGDQALTHVAHVIMANTRPDAVISRLGGDEIAILLPGCTHEVAVKRAGQIVVAVHASPLELANGQALTISVSAGVAHAPRDGQELDTVYAAADSALYVAKRNGRNQVAVTPGSD